MVVTWASNSSDPEDGFRPDDRYGIDRATVWSDEAYDRLADAIVRRAARMLYLDDLATRDKAKRKAKRKREKL